MFLQKLEEDLTAANSRLENKKKNLIATHSSFLEEKEKTELNSSNQQLAAEKIQLESLHQKEKCVLQLEVEQLPKDLQKYTISENTSFKDIATVSVFSMLKFFLLQLHYNNCYSY